MCPSCCRFSTEYGYTDVAYKLLEQEAYPLPDIPDPAGCHDHLGTLEFYTVESGFGDAGMNSFNHSLIWLCHGVGIQYPASAFRRRHDFVRTGTLC